MLSNTDNFINDALSKGYSVIFREDVNGNVAHIRHENKNVVVPYEDVKNHGLKVMEHIERKFKEFQDTQ